MISELTFAKRFTSFWNQLLPNEKHYVRLINDGLFEIVDAPTGELNRKENIALINELAFEIYKQILSNKIKTPSLDSIEFYKSDKFLEIYANAKKRLSKFAYGSNFSLPLTSKELTTTRMLTLRLYTRYYDSMKDIIISPFFSGCGYINHSNGDLYIPGRLIEIKSGARNFGVVDVRQILIYCTLNFYSKKRLVIDEVELFNPRMGISYSCKTNELCENLGSLNQEDLFFEIKQHITENSFIEGAIL
ncbi:MULTISPECIES: hypothetical protein [Serratia]|uniref:hypothetical protein n=1 Tax=Serratia TaxID=613 RepID=UPI0018D34021|nr:hypothetical protein [Serratia marcescens]MBH1917655.1 hypothetical protein [Serratia marcescens]MBH2679237.1 hypothetical protein [Serratia marcescens]MBN3977351.1 hypothetical protein [Serratia marcescens]